MATVLYIQASPRGDRSMSIALADAFLDAYARSHSDDTILGLDVFQAELPPFEGSILEAKYAILHGRKHTPEQLRAWKAVEAIIDRFKSADKHVLAVPMWNFGLPYRLKQYVDILVQPGYTFAYSPQEGYRGLVIGKPVFIAAARGGDYSAPEGAAMDFQLRYLEFILGLIGFADIRSLVVQPTLMGGGEVAERKLQEAVKQARLMADEF